MSQFVTVIQDEAVLRIGFNRPEKRNALTYAMYGAATKALERADDSGSVRVIVVHGSETCFTAGNDLTDFAEDPPRDDTSPVHQFVDRIARLKKPILAAVAGPAVGVGTTMLLHCDLVLASENSKFQLPFTSLGLCPEAGSSYLLPRHLGLQRASELLLLGRPFDSNRALELGLINRVCATGTVLSKALEWASELSQLPPASVRLTKALMRQGLASTLHDTMTTEAMHFVDRLRSAEATEAFAAFAEKRRPDFSSFV